MAHRLDYSWLEMEYPKRGKQTFRKLIPLKGLLQKNYGKRLDCTLTSLACIFGEQYYSDIEKIAEKYGYNGDKWGTNPLAVKSITKEFTRRWDIPGRAKSAYGKGVGWTWAFIKAIVSRDIPLVLNLWKDGRGYYKDHSVTIIGAEEYEKARFLLVLDNWRETVSLIDYEKLCIISSINYIDK
jgi:hypothetical protein|nr:MAG TPA_asm: cysteine protease [Caudoviricetes sp.]